MTLKFDEHCEVARCMIPLPRPATLHAQNKPISGRLEFETLLAGGDGENCHNQDSWFFGRPKNSPAFRKSKFRNHPMHSTIQSQLVR